MGELKLLAERGGFGLCYFLYETRSLGWAWSCILQIITQSSHRFASVVAGTRNRLNLQLRDLLEIVSLI